MLPLKNDEKNFDLDSMEMGSFNNIDISMLNVGIYHDSTQPNIHLIGINPLRAIDVYRSTQPGPR